MNPLQADAALLPGAHALPAAHARAAAPAGGGRGARAWPRALAPARGLDYGAWFKPVPEPASPASEPAGEAAQSPRAPRGLASVAATARPPAMNPDWPPEVFPSQPSHAGPEPVDVPAARQAALATDVAMAWTGFAAAPSSEMRPATVPSTTTTLVSNVAALAPGATTVAFSTSQPLARSAAEPAEPSQPTRPPARAAIEQEPLRVHAQWATDGVSIWLGCDADAMPALGEFIARLQHALAARGERLARIVCNGREVWHALPPSGSSSSPLLFNRPYEAP